MPRAPSGRRMASSVGCSAPTETIQSSGHTTMSSPERPGPTTTTSTDGGPTSSAGPSTRSNGLCSIKHPGANVYVVKYTHDPTPDAMMAAYDSALSAASLNLNTPPASSRKNGCGFETTWGPTSGSSVLGRVACFHAPKPDGTYHVLWTVDAQLTLVEAVSPSLSDVTQFFKAFSVASQTTSPHIGT